MSARKVLHPLTLAFIEAQGRRMGAPGWRCGCEQRQGKWWLCGYHDGYEDALDVLTGKLDAIHRPIDEMGGIWCDQDSQVWPCATHRIIHGDDR